MKPSVLLVSLLANGTAGMVIVLAVARYYIWSVREASLTICFIFNFVPGLFTLTLTLVMIAM